jgi:hypothetical protein
MSGAIPPLPQYAFVACCLVKAQGQLYIFTLKLKAEVSSFISSKDPSVD